MLRVTKTENGAVRGLPGTNARVTVFKGIPFAADTAGENRWRPPQPAKDWEGVRDCFEFGPIPMQRTPGLDPNAFYSKEWHVDPDVPMSEDCLSVNIWTPAKSTDEKLPVMVWIFGGGYKEGYSYEMEFDGEAIASRGVILVSVAYRVNVFGFLAHPEITAENPDAPTNLGLLDQRAGIEWVKRNIANFGGDPENITIFGQSAGGGSVMYHLTAPGNEGLFQKAIVQSFGGIRPNYPRSPFPLCKTLKEQEEIGKKFFEETLGVKTLAEARKLDGAYIEQKFLETNLWLEVVVDDKYVLGESSDLALQDKVLRVPLLYGHTIGESNTAPGQPHPMANPDFDSVTAEMVEHWTKDNLGPHAEEYLAIAKENAVSDAPADVARALCLNASELRHRMLGEVLNSQGRDIYYYAFGPEIPGDNAGSFHSSDLWFTFETLRNCWRPFTGKHYDLARHMCNYWTNFAKNGDPNGLDADGTPMPEWKPYTDTPFRMEFLDKATPKEGKPAANMQYLIETNLKELKG